MGSPVSNAGIFLIKVVFDLYIFVMMLRFLLQLKGANPSNPIARIIIQVTRPLVMPLQKVLPCIAKVNLCVLFWLIALEAIKLLLLTWIGSNNIPEPLGLAIWSIGSLIGKLMNLYFFAILIQVILSWVQPSQNNPALEILYVITSPVLGPIQRIIPSLGGLDISPIFAMIGIQIVNILVSQPIIGFGATLALRGIAN